MNYTPKPLSLFLVVALCGAGCGDDTTTPMDAGTDTTGTDTPGTDTPGTDTPGTDAGRDTTPPTMLGTCAMPVMLTGELDATASHTGDTTGGFEAPLNLGEACGPAEDAAPQEVIAYTVPGTGDVAVTFSMVNAGTPDTFDTLIQVRTDCSAIPENPDSCFDDVSGEDLRSGGSYLATGGEMIFIVVSGYTDTPVEGATDEGAYTIEITPTLAVAPVITAATAGIAEDGTFAFRVEGTIESGSAESINVEFLDGEGNPVDLDESGAAGPEDVVTGVFQNAAELVGMSPWVGNVGGGGTLGERLLVLDPAEVRIRAVSAVGLESEPLEVPFGALVALDGACGDAALCVPTLECVASVCSFPAAVVAACDAAPAAVALVAPTPTMSSRSAEVMGELGEEEGVLSGSCGMTGLNEGIHTVTVPAGTFDLVATTATATTGESDTVVYIRSTCADASTEVDCNDDLAAMMLASQAEVLNVAAGTYTVVVERYTGADEGPVPYGIEFLLRPIVATGAACDPMGINNRCMAAPCDMATMMCPAAP